MAKAGMAVWGILGLVSLFTHSKEMAPTAAICITIWGAAEWLTTQIKRH